MGALSRITYLSAGRVLIATAILTALAAVLMVGVFDHVKPFDISDPDSEVERAREGFEAATGHTAEPEIVLLVRRDPDGPPLGGLEDVARTLRSVPDVSEVITPRSEPELLASDRESFLVAAYLDAGATRVDAGEAAVGEFASDPDVLVGGTAAAAYEVGLQSESDTRHIELYAAPVLLLMLLVVFRTLVAAVLPLICAGIAIAATMATLRLLTNVTTIDLFSLQTVTALGAGLAINYSLFVLARYRERLRAGDDYTEAHMNTITSAGRTVAFSAITVAAALASLLVFPQPFLSSTGIAGALTAVFCGVAALVVLPACLALLGPAVNSLAVRRDPLRSESIGRGDLWWRLPRAVCSRPVVSLAAGLAVMLVFAVQAREIDLFTPDARELPAEASARQVAERATADFPDVPRTTLYAVLPTEESLAAARDVLQALPAVEQVSRSRHESVPILHVNASMDPLSDDGEALVDDVRAALPAGTLVGGRAAEQADQRSSIASHAPAAIALIVISSLLLMAALTRSVLVPLLALAVNVLTVLAALGLLVVAFTTEGVASILGTDAQDGIDISVPVITFAIVFGLSTDYGIFLLARIREEWRTGAGEEQAIITGVATTGRLISASAALMAVAVGAFVFSDVVIVKEFAVAFAVAVLLDATVVRGLIIPAALKLLGRWAWWHPRRRSPTMR